ncbi:MAG: FAD:protein FMN transferase [Mariprofundus sp.]|nr:FAD:protein FMN transferase [Mariprofundus sp.]
MFFSMLGRICATYILLLLTACSSPKELHDSRFIMGTLVEFTVSDTDRTIAEQAIAEAANEMQRIEDSFTIYGDHPNSVKLFNISAVDHPVSLPDEVSKLLETALAVQQQSGNRFNPALARLNLLWGFSLDPPPNAPPSDLAIRTAIPPSECIKHIAKQWARSDRRCQLDFGGIAKGYAIDRGIDILKKHGIANAIINAGGDMRLIGQHHQQPWKIGIRHPRKAGSVLSSLSLQGDVSIVTSGDYERFFIYQGKQYHHILDPKNGYPARKNQSITVIAPSAMLADAWSTALFVGSPATVPSAIRFLSVSSSGHIVDNLRIKK